MALVRSNASPIPIMKDSRLIEIVLDAVDQAGRAVLSARWRGAVPTTKADGSPITRADLDSERILTEQLKQQFPDTPVVSEEAAFRPAEVPSRFFLIDPLDGTKEFIAGRDEFTVNVALVEDGYPIVGVIGAPALGRLVVGISGAGNFERTTNGSLAQVHRSSRHEGDLRVLVSRSHLDPESERALARLPQHQLRAMGSSLKFLSIAMDEADLYVRFAPTMGWDTAAGQAIVEAAGGVVLVENGTRLNYALCNDFRNRGFVAAASMGVARLVLPAARASGAG